MTHSNEGRFVTTFTLSLIWSFQYSKMFEMNMNGRQAIFIHHIKEIGAESESEHGVEIRMAREGKFQNATKFYMRTFIFTPGTNPMA